MVTVVCSIDVTFLFSKYVKAFFSSSTFISVMMSDTPVHIQPRKLCRLDGTRLGRENVYKVLLSKRARKYNKWIKRDHFYITNFDNPLFSKKDYSAFPS